MKRWASDVIVDLLQGDVAIVHNNRVHRHFNAPATPAGTGFEPRQDE